MINEKKAMEIVKKLIKDNPKTMQLLAGKKGKVGD